MRKQITSLSLAFLLLLSLLTGCSQADAQGAMPTEPSGAQAITSAPSDTLESPPAVTYDPVLITEEPSASTGDQSATSNIEKDAAPVQSGAFQISDIPGYSGGAYAVVHDNRPYFQSDELSTSEFEHYSELDSLGRCGAAFANVSLQSMPTEKRGAIGQVKPSGWHTVKYDCVDGKYLYNRCHLIGYQLTAENANEKNLITGTRYLNIEGMLPFENMVADYVKETGNHVAYRVTPVYEGENLLAGGVLMEGYSVEDEGDGICFCVFAYNVQPGVDIDYATGDSQLSADDGTENSGSTAPSPSAPSAAGPSAEPEESAPAVAVTYIANTNTRKFHYPSCSSVGQMNEANKWVFTGTAEELVQQGYVPCKRCRP